ncbi:MAG: NAD-dependent malic enzyme, partial [bacterium]
GDINPGKELVLPYLSDPGQDQSMQEAVEGKDVFIGLSAPGILSQDDVRAMNDDPVIIAGAAPDPEISPEEAYEAGASVVCTARFDYP